MRPTVIVRAARSIECAWAQEAEADAEKAKANAKMMLEVSWLYS